MSEEKETEKPEGSQEAAPERNFEADARKEGWTPKEDWEAAGKDPAKWRSAEDFVKAGENILPMVKKKLDRALKEINRLNETQTKERKATLAAMEQQQRSYETRLKEARAEAIAKGDGKLVNDIDDKIDESKEKRREITEELKATPEKVEMPEFQDFVEENQWYITDKRMKRVADAIGMEIREEHPEMPADKFFREVAKAVKSEFPEKFKKPASPEGSARGSDSGSKQKGIPKDTKAMFERMAQIVPAADRPKFIENATRQYLAEQE